MNLASVLLYPFALLLPAADALDDGAFSDAAGIAQALQTDPSQAGDSWVWPVLEPRAIAPDLPFTRTVRDSVAPADADQVRVEQRMIIRITPRAAAPIRPEMFMAMPEDDGPPRYVERKIGKCIAVSGIAGVQADRDDRLLFVMRDRRVIRAELGRSCRASDFYSGFLLNRTSDGQICVDRDTLLTRSGMNCKLSRIRQLVSARD